MSLHTLLLRAVPLPFPFSAAPRRHTLLFRASATPILRRATIVRPSSPPTPVPHFPYPVTPYPTQTCSSSSKLLFLKRIKKYPACHPPDQRLAGRLFILLGDEATIDALDADTRQRLWETYNFRPHFVPVPSNEPMTTRA